MAYVRYIPKNYRQGNGLRFSGSSYINMFGDKKAIEIKLDRLIAERHFYKVIVAKFDSPCEVVANLWENLTNVHEPMVTELLCEGVRKGDEVIFHTDHHEGTKGVYHLECISTIHNWIAAPLLDSEVVVNEDE